MQRLRSLSISGKSKNIEFNRLDLGRILLLARNCFSKLQKETLQRQFGKTGILREPPAAGVAHHMIQEVFDLLMKTQPRLSELFAKPNYENVNLLFRLLSTFLTNAEALQVTDISEDCRFDTANEQADAFEHYLQKLAEANHPKLSVIAELIHETLNFSATVLDAQMNAENTHLESHGMSILISPLLCSLLNRAGNAFDLIVMIPLIERELQHRLSKPFRSFFETEQACYHKNTRHMSKDTNPDLVHLALEFRKLFSEMIKLRSQLNKQWHSLNELHKRFENTPLPAKRKDKILHEVQQSYHTANADLMEKREQLEKLYHQLSRASVLQAIQSGGQYTGDVSREAAGLAFFKSQSRSQGSLPCIPASPLHENRCRSYDALPKPLAFKPSFIDEDAISKSADASPQASIAASLPNELAKEAVTANRNRLRRTLVFNSSVNETILEESPQENLTAETLPDVPVEKYKSLLSELIHQLGIIGEETNEADEAAVADAFDVPVIPDLSDLGDSCYPQP